MTTTPSTAVAVRRPNLLSLSLSEIRERAEIFIKSGLLPESIKTVEQAILIALKGQELGLPMLQAFEDLYVIRGKVGMFTRLMVTRYLDRGHVYHIAEATPKRCVVQFVRSDGRHYEHIVTIEEAVAAGWDKAWDNETKSWKDKPTWKNPRVMLTWAAFRNGIRFFAPDVLDADALEADVVDGVVVMPEDDVDDMPVETGGAIAPCHRDSVVQPPVQSAPVDWGVPANREALIKAQEECKLDEHDAILALSKAAGTELTRRSGWTGTLAGAIHALRVAAAERDGQPIPENPEAF